MSAEMITTLVGVVSILLAFAGGFGWLIHRMDGQHREVKHDMVGLRDELGGRIDRLGVRIDTVEDRLGARIDRVNHELGARIDKVDHELGARIDRMSDELVEVKIAIARVEGPPRHLIAPR